MRRQILRLSRGELGRLCRGKRGIAIRQVGKEISNRSILAEVRDRPMGKVSV
ncbi:MAG: hypothetical protein KME21_21950 [Desmonostoc vinosum HA7617-LM4]|jgi:hypothetical protein|nr:hypothetical protein [Desmonostoc vinosum HA7617-LM4]